MKMVECVPNFSEGRRKEIVDDIVESISAVQGVRILDVEMDQNHNRCVVSFTADQSVAVEAAFRGIKRSSELIDLNKHTGEHPRFGSADVVPFIPLSGSTMEDCIKLARDLGKRVGEELHIPVYMYGEASMKENRKNLEDIRNKNFQYEQLKESIREEKWRPDFGPASMGKEGATIIGARDFLIAYNVNLNSTDLSAGKKIARALRSKDGGLTFVKSLAFFLEDKKQVQISMNLTNFRKTPIYRAFEMVRIEASRFGITIAESEVIGLVPMDALMEASKFYLQLNNFKMDQILEKKVWGE
ncbi:glutamate formimidoyltransferase [Oxyplasma meridianum]|uniref:glutamate formimidoyltransferase n=1 Tax=Oxyplasma meridianum TaxID=3073602 RepID=A0AAX4NIX0_9ARCH